jgi:hypothetical protein
MDTSTTDLTNIVTIGLTMDVTRLQTSFYCNKTMQEVQDYYQMATKMYDLNISDLADNAHARREDYECLVCISEDWMIRLKEMFVDDQLATALVRPDNHGELVLTMESVNILVMHYIRLLCHDLRWKVIDSVKTTPRYSKT